MYGSTSTGPRNAQLGRAHTVISPWAGHAGDKLPKSAELSS